jgi:hypothetical protein
VIDYTKVQFCDNAGSNVRNVELTYEDYQVVSFIWEPNTKFTRLQVKSLQSSESRLFLFQITSFLSVTYSISVTCAQSP